MMHVRDAVESDIGALASMAHAPKDVMVNVIHDRTVRIAERKADSQSAGDGSTEGNVEADDHGASDGRTEEDEKNEQTGEVAENDENEKQDEIVGFVGFDAGRHAVYVTHLGGTEQSLQRLLDEPVRFARKEEMPVEMVVPESETDQRTVVEEFGFVQTGVGPRFEGSSTVKYRLEQ